MPVAGTDAVLSALIKSRMAANGIVIADDAELSKLTDAIAKAVIDHFVANALIAVIGITPGGGTTTGTIT